jgi:hypothetical protein
VASNTPTNAQRTARNERWHPGASAAREHERRRRSREARTRADHPLIGGLLLALGGAPQHEDAFRRGAAGERAVADSLERRTAASDAILLHDRRMPNGRGNIDQLAIAATGVYVIDAKDHHGKVRISTPLFGAPTLQIAGRDRTSLLDGLDRQVAVVRDTLDATGLLEVPVHGVLCFTNADLPLLGTTPIRGHLLLYRKALAKRINAPDPLTKRVRSAPAYTLAARCIQPERRARRRSSSKARVSRSTKASRRGGPPDGGSPARACVAYARLMIRCACGFCTAFTRGAAAGGSRRSSSGRPPRRSALTRR